MADMNFVAGKEVWDGLVAEKEATVSRNPQGFYASRELIALQSRQHTLGYRGVQLVESLYGWTVRADSGLDSFNLLAGARSGALDGTWESAVMWAQAWCRELPTHRYAWYRPRGH